MRVLDARDLYRFYHAGEEETFALRGVTLHVDRGETVALVGPSGSGKSTLLACLAGLDEPDGGWVEVAGRRLTRRPESVRAAMRAASIGILLQSGNLFNHLTTRDNILLQMRLADRVDRVRLSALLHGVHLWERRHARPAELSGGEAARAGLAVALAAAPPVLLADEPTAEVDADTEAQLVRLFDERRGAGGATLIATHSQRLAQHADRVLHLQDGRLIEAD